MRSPLSHALLAILTLLTTATPTPKYNTGISQPLVNLPPQPQVKTAPQVKTGVITANGDDLVPLPHSKPPTNHPMPITTCFYVESGAPESPHMTNENSFFDFEIEGEHWTEAMYGLRPHPGDPLKAKFQNKLTIPATSPLRTTHPHIRNYMRDQPYIFQVVNEGVGHVKLDFKTQNFGMEHAIKGLVGEVLTEVTGVRVQCSHVLDGEGNGDSETESEDEDHEMGGLR